MVVPCIPDACEALEGKVPLSACAKEAEGIKKKKEPARCRAGSHAP